MADPPAAQRPSHDRVSRRLASIARALEVISADLARDRTHEPPRPTNLGTHAPSAPQPVLVIVDERARAERLQTLLAQVETNVARATSVMEAAHGFVEDRVRRRHGGSFR